MGIGKRTKFQFLMNAAIELNLKIIISIWIQRFRSLDWRAESLKRRSLAVSSGVNRWRACAASRGPNWNQHFFNYVNWKNYKIRSFLLGAPFFEWARQTHQNALLFLCIFLFPFPEKSSSSASRGNLWLWSFSLRTIFSPLFQRAYLNCYSVKIH